MPEYDGYNRDRDRYNDQGEGLIQRYERLRYNGIRPVFSDEGKYIPLEQHFKEESELYARFGSNSALSDVKNLSQVEKLVKAVEASGNYLEDEIVEELRAIFTPATLATMVGVFAVYVAAHATGVGQAADILMLLAGGIFFGLDTISIFKDIAGFANAMSATSQEDLDKAGQHLANLVATVSVDVVMTLLTSKVADKISSGINKTSGVEKPGTTTKDLVEPGGKNNPNPDNGSMRSIENVNPGFPKPGRTENCVNCSVATDATLKGNPAQALPGFKTDVRKLEQLYKRKFMTVSSKETIIQVFEQAGDGQKGIVLVKYKKPNPAIPEGFNIFWHVFNVDNQKGVVRFLDGQTGKIADFEHVIELKVMPTN